MGLVGPRVGDLIAEAVLAKEPCRICSWTIEQFEQGPARASAQCGWGGVINRV